MRILFVCHGNICRSPMAEFVMKKLVADAGREDEFEIASAATSTEEIGNAVYPPAPANAIAEFVAQYNEEHQYAMILATAGSILSTPVVCGDARLDITEDLLAGLNAAYIKTKETTKK